MQLKEQNHNSVLLPALVWQSILPFPLHRPTQVIMVMGSCHLVQAYTYTEMLLPSHAHRLSLLDALVSDSVDTK